MRGACSLQRAGCSSDPRSRHTRVPVRLPCEAAMHMPSRLQAPHKARGGAGAGRGRRRAAVRAPGKPGHRAGGRLGLPPQRTDHTWRLVSTEVRKKCTLKI